MTKFRFKFIKNLIYYENIDDYNSYYSALFIIFIIK